MSSDCPRREDMVELLTGAPEARSADLRDHLDACEECRREWSQLVGMPELVRRGATFSRELAAAAPDGVGMDRLLRQLRRRRRRRAGTRLAVAAVVLAAAVIALVALLPSHPGSSPTVRLAATSASGVRLDASLSPRRWGTAMDVTAAGLPPDVRCELVVDGRGVEQAAGWVWSAAGTIRGVAASTSLHLPQITGVELLVDGHVAARAGMPPSRP